MNSDDKEMPDTDTGKENQDSFSEEKQPRSRTENSTTKPDVVQEKRSSKPVTTDKSEKPADIICPSQDKCSGKELQEPLKDGIKLSSENKDASQATVSQSGEDASQPEATRDVEMKDLLQAEKDPQDVVKTVEGEVQQAKEEGAKDVLSTPDMSLSRQPIGSASAPENGTGGPLSLSDTLNILPALHCMILLYLICLLPKCCFAGENPNKEGKKEKDVCEGTKDKHNIEKLKRAAISAISAAAVKAKNLAKQEEDQIRQFSGSLIEKQVRYGLSVCNLDSVLSMYMFRVVT